MLASAWTEKHWHVSQELYRAPPFSRVRARFYLDQICIKTTQAKVRNLLDLERSDR
mgnify:CR=1 FL=1